MRSVASRRSDILQARKRRSLGSYSYGLLQLEYLEDRVLLAGTPTQLIWSQYPTSVAQGSPAFPTITLNIVDATGAVVTTDTSRVSLLVVPGQSPLNGSISGTTAISAVGGVANFTNVSFTQVGVYTIMASDTTDGLQTLASIQITVNSSASQLAYVSEPANITAGTPFSLTVSVQDANDNIVTTDHSNLTLSIDSGPTGASISGTTTAAVLYPTGQGTFNGLTLTVPGKYKLQVKDSQNGIATVISHEFTVNAGAPAKLSFSQQPANTPVNSTVTPALQVNVLDSLGNIVTTDNSAVTLLISSGPAGATIKGTQTVNAINGVATFGGISFDQLGSYRLQASDGSLTAAISNSFAVTGPAVKLAFQGAPAQSTVGTVVTPLDYRIGAG